MFCRILIMAGLYLNLNHHLNFSDDRQMVIFILMGAAIAFDVVLTGHKRIVNIIK